MGAFRLSLYDSLESRSPLEEKDSQSLNVLYEKADEDTVYAIKRAGTSLFLARTGGAEGIFTYGTNLYSWTLTDNPLIPTVTAL